MASIGLHLARQYARISSADIYICIPRGEL